MELNAQKMEQFRERYPYFLAVLGIAFLLIFVRLWHLQVIKGPEYRRISENNRIRIRYEIADRGTLLDRRGRVVASNRPCFEVSLVPEDIRANPEVVRAVAQILGMNEELINQKLQTDRKSPPFMPVKIKSDITWQELALLESNRIHLPGVVLDVTTTRNYEYGELAAHLIGYIGEVDEAELKNPKPVAYRMGSIIGKYGIERLWDAELRGVDGGGQIEVDALGREIKPLRRIEPIAGNGLTLTIDLDLQQTAEEAFEGKNGALIAMDPRTGEILAMLSKPSFNPNLFAGTVPPDYWKSLVQNPDHPLQNKGIQGIYPPGSVFKIVTAVAALESGVATPGTCFTCTGAYRYGNRDFRCYKKEGHGTIDLYRAIVQSCDVYFYQLGLKVGVDRIARYATEFGLGKKTGIALPYEKAGIVPSSSWKLKQMGVPWYSGETLSLAVGQGYIAVTPIQLLTLISAVANGGRIYQPQVVKRLQSPTGATLQEFTPVEKGRVHVSDETLRFIRLALRGAVNDPGGTGWQSAIKDVGVSGKTGTAQVVGLNKDFRRGDMERMPLKLRDHAWFAAFAPFEFPEIAVVVLVEHGGFGGVAAAPIAKKVIEKYLALKNEVPSVVTAKAQSFRPEALGR